MTYSVVISSYKYGHLAAHCIESVLAQTKQFDKIYFVDDAVGDCSHLPFIYPNLEYVFRHTNLGVVANFQGMLNRVNTDYVMFLGADNWLRSDALEILSQYESDIVTYDILVTGQLRNEIHQFYPNQMTKHQGDWHWERKYQHHGSMLYNVAKAKLVGGYEDNKGIRTDEDLNLWNKLTKNGASVVYVPEAFLYYRRHKENYNKY